MNLTRFQVEAFWDREAQVWVAESDDVPGLVTEADTIEELTEKLKQIIPELMVANCLVSPDYTGAITFSLTSHRQESIQVA
jgi:predicted RNase H-like HicB family nuclease